MPMSTEMSPRMAMSTRTPPESSLSAMAITIRNSPLTNSQIPSSRAKP